MGNTTLWQRTGETGIEKLAIAVMDQGRKDLMSENAKIKNDAERWVRSDDMAAFSFASICCAFGTDVQEARKALLDGTM